MSRFHEKAGAQPKQTIGQMLGDEFLFQEGKNSNGKRRNLARPTMAMTRASSVTSVDRKRTPTRSAPSA